VRTSDAPRSTHFADKEELLSGLDDLRRMIRSAGRAGKPLAFTPGLLDHAHENKRMFRALLGKRAISARMWCPHYFTPFWSFSAPRAAPRKRTPPTSKPPASFDTLEASQDPPSASATPQRRLTRKRNLAPDTAAT
jgi:hypothetical protein